MKRSIDGKVYDTDTAVLIGKWSDRKGTDRSFHIHESLYRKRTGEYFILGEGGTMTKYAELHDNGDWSSGARIIPLSFTAAKDWGKEHLSSRTYKMFFEIDEKDDTKVHLCISLTRKAADMARVKASKKDQSLSTYIEGLIIGKGGDD